MLRTLLGEPPREWDAALGATVDAIDLFMRLCQERSTAGEERGTRYRTYAVWAEGLRRSLYELEESLFAAKHFALLVRHVRWDELTDSEKQDYDRHVYFDKNAYIRMFSVLDKLGTLLNAFLELKTEKMKVHFSYYTVLRNLRPTGRFAELSDRLTELKERHRDAMSRLRTRRNMEIHYMNAELQDDLDPGGLEHNGTNGSRLESLSASLADAEEGWVMVRETLHHAFRFACGWLRRSS